MADRTVRVGITVGVRLLLANDIESSCVMESRNTVLLITFYTGSIFWVSRNARSFTVIEPTYTHVAKGGRAVGSESILVSHALVYTRSIDSEYGGAFVRGFLKSSTFVHLKR